MDKTVTTSKLNATGLIMVLLGAITDPSFHILFGDIVPQEWMSRILFLAGWIVIGLRTFGTTQPVSRNGKMPWESGSGS